MFIFFYILCHIFILSGRMTEPYPDYKYLQPKADIWSPGNNFKNICIALYQAINNKDNQQAALVKAAYTLCRLSVKMLL